MRIRALYVGKTYAFGSKEMIEYAIVNENDRTDIDVVILSKEPQVGKKKFADPAKGWLEVPAWEVRDRVLIISGRPRRAATTPIVRLDDVRVEKHIMAKEGVDVLLKKAEELERKVEEEALSDEDRIIKINGMEFAPVMLKAPTDVNDLTNTLLNAYNIVTASRKRVFVAAPAFAEILGEWYVVTWPKVLHFVREHPDALIQLGVIDPNGFNTPYMIVKGLAPEDLGTIDEQRSNVDWLDRILRAGARFGGGMGGLGGTGGVEETSPFG
jgi:hypothetical protein